MTGSGPSMIDRLLGRGERTDTDIERRIEDIDDRRRYEAIVSANEQKAYDYLYVKTFDKVRDSSYMAYINALMAEYFNKHNP